MQMWLDVKHSSGNYLLFSFCMVIEADSFANTTNFINTLTLGVSLRNFNCINLCICTIKFDKMTKLNETA